MSHLHIPDGLLPVWLWAAGLLVMACITGLSLAMVRGMDLKRKVPLLGMMSAMMLVGMNIEVPPYHMNLSVMTGILLGPWLAVLAVLIVNLILALVGHGGITVVGINTTLLATEAVMGCLLFRAFSMRFRPALSAGLAACLALISSTCIMLAVVFAANVDFSAAPAEGLREVMESGLAGALRGGGGLSNGFNFRLFAAASLLVGVFGWTVESLVTAAVVRFIALVKPQLLSGSSRAS